jgi:hypothetical protein
MTFARIVNSLVRLPKDILQRNEMVLESMRDAAPLGAPTRPPDSIDNLSERNRFVVAASNLRIATWVKYHSILGSEGKDGEPVEDTSDGVVPYWSSHLDGAESERIVRSSHGVQETPAAMLEMRRILHLHAEKLAKPQGETKSPLPFP